MDRILFGDNQFFAVNHMSDEKARAQALRFKDIRSVMETIDYVYDIGIRTFMCTTHDRIAEICDHIRANPGRYDGFKIYPCMPYAHKYNNAVAELGVIGALKKMLPGSVIGTMARGGIALARKDYIAIMRLLIDAEMKMFHDIETKVIFLQNIVTDLLLGMGMSDFFVAFADYVREKYQAEPGFITMNLPPLLDVLEKNGIENPIICTSINKIGFRMPGGLGLYEKTIASGRCRTIAMQALAAGAIPPGEAMEYVCRQNGIQSVLFGASTKAHIQQTMDYIEKFSVN
jgi:hypothetical protein